MVTNYQHVTYIYTHCEHTQCARQSHDSSITEMISPFSRNDRKEKSVIPDAIGNPVYLRSADLQVCCISRTKVLHYIIMNAPLTKGAAGQTSQ